MINWILMLKNWHTTVLGALVAIIILATQAVAFLDSDPKTEVDWVALTAAAGFFGLGVSAKDASGSGGK